MHRQSPFRYAAELAVGVMLLALVLRTWFVMGLVMPITVAGGSMAPVLRGPHREAVCGACGQTLLVGLERLPAGGRAVCPHCGDRAVETETAAEIAGDRLLVDRTAFEFRNPRRWELVVFRCPENADDYCIKRVVGLPGESIQIRRGDVYADGKIARKDLSQCRTLAQKVYTAGHGRPRWQAENPRSRWESDDRPERRTFVYPEHATDGKGSIDWLGYHHPGDQPISDDVPYNQGESRALNEVSDLLVTCRVKLTGRGELTFSATAGQRRFTIGLAPNAARLRLIEADQPSIEVALDKSAAAALARGGALLELAMVDRQVLLAVDRRVQLVYVYPPSDAPDRPTSRPLAIGSRGLGAQISELVVWRDVYYTATYTEKGATGGSEAEATFRLAADEFFVLGDNSPISADSRSWTHAGLRAKLLVGKPLGAD